MDYGPSSLLDAVQGLSPGQRERLIGNSMHCASQAAFMMYIICNTYPREYATFATLQNAVEEDDVDECA